MEARLTEIRNIIRISFTHNKHIQTLKMDNCDRYFANAFFLNVSSSQTPLNKIFIKCKQAINTLLDNWKGVRKSKTEKNSFRKYFKVARNSFDQSKHKVISTEFWSPIFDLVTKFAFSVADKSVGRYQMQSNLKEYGQFLQELVCCFILIHNLKIT